MYLGEFQRAPRRPQPPLQSTRSGVLPPGRPDRAPRLPAREASDLDGLYVPFGKGEAFRQAHPARPRPPGAERRRDASPPSTAARVQVEERLPRRKAAGPAARPLQEKQITVRRRQRALIRPAIPKGAAHRPQGGRPDSGAFASLEPGPKNCQASSRDRDSGPSAGMDNPSATDHRCSG